VRRLSLRVRLILAVIVLAAGGLVAADAVTYHELSSFEISHTDDSLDAAHRAATANRPDGAPPGFHLGNLGPPRGAPGGTGAGTSGSGAIGTGATGTGATGTGAIGTGDPNASDAVTRRNAPIRQQIGPLSLAAPGFYIERLTLTGKLIDRRFTGQFEGTATPPAPKLPTHITIPPATSGPDRVTYLTTGAVSGGSRYRVRASIEPGVTDRILVIAAPLNAVDSTLHRLLIVEIVATAAVLAGIALLGLWVVRLGLRPLEAMGRTASAIAAGDLSRRVDQTDERTEVGKLGVALNSMLHNIETAVTARESSLRALEASESKLRRFVADASHELRTPLAAVRAYAELFTRGAASRPADLERSMTGISRESERMSVLVEDLLLLAHLDEGRPLQHETVQLEEVVAESIETAKTLEPDRPIEVELEPTVVAGDRDRLRQVVDNLLSNVRAHTPPEALLRVTLERSGKSAILRVADSGSGLDDDELTHIFERFYRADPSRARSSGGAGLGLAIVSAVVGAHGGTVHAESTPGTGTTFAVELPLAGN
jgi:two-component system OmpR family sensor kinase